SQSSAGGFKRRRGPKPKAGLEGRRCIRLPAPGQHGAHARRRDSVAGCATPAPLGETRTFGSPARGRDILAGIADAMAETMREIRAYGKEHAEFAEIGGRMIQQWEEGVRVSLKEA